MEEKSLNVEVNKLENKKYQLDVLSLIVYNSWMNDDQTVRMIKKKDLRKILVESLKIDSRKTTRLLNNFIDLGILEVKGYDYIVHKAKPPYLKIPISTVKFCLEHMSDLDFKVYCVLLNMFNKHQYYGYSENYFFSKKELLEGVGYTNNARNLHIADEALVILKKLGFIEYDGPKKRIDKNGKKSKAYYFELLKVNLIPKVKKEADHQYLSVGGKVNRENYLDFAPDIIKEFPEAIEKEVVQIGIDKTLEELIECTRGLNEHNTPYYKEARILWEQFHNYFEGRPIELEITSSIREACIAVYGKDYCDALKCKNS